MDLLFDWNDEKAEQNLRDHGVDFEDAVAVWNDLFRDEWFDERDSYGEDRWVTVGVTAHGMLTVVYTVRRSAEGEAIWLISAWPSTRTEQDRYSERLRP
jgi:uncharacterized DUF497 family protein